MITSQVRGNGNGPPPNANASDLWIKFSEMPRPISPRHMLRAKGKDVGELVFKVLTASELSHVYGSAHRKTVELLGDPDAKPGTLAYEEIYNDQKAIELVVLACWQADNPEFRVFFSAESVRENMTDDEIAVLAKSYAMFRVESGPIVASLTEAELEAWIEVLSKGVSRFPLARLSGEALIDLVMHLVSKLRAASSTVTSSAGAQPESPSTQTPQSASPSGSTDTETH